MMDAYSLIKILNQEKGVKKFSIFINKASSELEAKQNFEVFSKNLVHKFLDAELIMLVFTYVKSLKTSSYNEKTSYDT